MAKKETETCSFPWNHLPCFSLSGNLYVDLFGVGREKCGSLHDGLLPCAS